MRPALVEITVEQRNKLKAKAAAMGVPLKQLTQAVIDAGVHAIETGRAKLKIGVVTEKPKAGKLTLGGPNP